jgi:hypothetical protein
MHGLVAAREATLVKRWIANITYRTRDGTTVQAVEFEEFEEFEDLGVIMERGPSWSVVAGIEIKLQRVIDDENLPRTLEDEIEQQRAIGVRVQ